MSYFLTLASEVAESLLPTVAFASEEEKEQDEPVEVESDDDESEEKEDDDEEEDEDDDDDDDDDEVPDPAIALHEAAAEGPCHDFKHHFDECVERVTKAQEAEDYDHAEYKEDCVEEFFHLQHCINDNTADKLFRVLK
ncbi:ubiquinol-cytochrome C reductase hinge domain-containing protein [Yarrowia lipolytica]|uniref:YALI0F24673p n=2 Tax=Yarrowia lipolytica TaxID=4952 RepID=Q6C0H4_YARLI|nr:YALI0F24673p [Yarrowia lipolytica CLIB122]8AB6_F Chain F, YALI0F24673p [Yarrowia lipolytica]8AB6_Q Chain Q, YALI0F24673p [Yarrowia lipolytica]8AB7_F Chain F, YALI0F24673p [Yarrowia lipolytica]8AB7_Q Chain Q, YALI0F24673p [Yarrowia lipolytica]8AB8_F Chain F, YALI0F24673p [Yarrowia lipolytica]8AB8_Q Chain Q, YALI0F24673p [Yarrowia lipolytica]8AB9_F Chain F, YALI0F24673p [Yarrowia lipolytica]8AB9_Q Chain Q, YALI0F24673p [Yarrowia lipolytica]8ABA_F Chain F, YALI0F24673p [Yarrowia lipolytica|eukprot:XP_505838.1 YALI0F24673p [Yarrowia lipolytica CLIB122]